jgi:hypothetical protein
MCAAAACAVLTYLLRGLRVSPSYAALGALALGLSRAFWSQAIVAEVYSLNALLCLLLVILSLQVRHGQRGFSILALVYGLSLANHWPLVLLSSPGLVLILWPRLPDLPRQLHRALPLFCLGLLPPYAYMVWRSLSASPVIFAGPIDSIEKFLFFIGRRGYSAASPSASVGDLFRFVGLYLREIPTQMSVPGALLALMGLGILWRRWPRGLWGASLYLFLGNTFLLCFLLRYDFDFYERQVMVVYPLVAYAQLAIWLAFSLEFIGRRGRLLFIPGSLLGPLVGACLLAAMLGLHGPRNWRANDVWAREYATALLNSLPADAVLFTQGDFDTGPLAYMRLVEGVRPDVTLYHPHGLFFSNRLFPPPPGNPGREDIRQTVEDFIEQSPRPVFSIGSLDHGFRRLHYGLYDRVDTSARRGEGASINHDLLAYVRRIAAQDAPRDAWSERHRRELMSSFVTVLAPVVHLQGQQESARRHAALLDTLTSIYRGRLELVRVLQFQEQPERLLQWLRETEELRDASVSKPTRASLESLRASIEERQGETELAIASYQRSLEIYPHPWRNAALGKLGRLYARMGRGAALKDLEAKYGIRLEDSSPMN